MGVMSALVDNQETYETYSAAVIAALNGAIATDGLNMSTVAKQIGVDYGTLRRYLRNEREIPVLVLYAIIDQISIDEGELFRRARALFDQK